MTRTLIIPDIHNRFYEAEGIIMKESPDKIVFLGDYFDDFGDTMECALQTAVWLKQSMEIPNRIHLLGNHDLSYMDYTHRCAGWNESKQYVINKSGVDLTRLKLYTYVGDWLCTHAGLSNEFYDAYNHLGLNPYNFLQRYENDSKLRHRLYQVSPFRGGRDGIAGILWCDYEEFEDIPNVKQIFGHTHDVKPRVTYNHICLDTFLRYYAVYNNDKMEIKKVE